MPSQQYGLCRTPTYGAAFAYADLPDLDAWIPSVLATAKRASTLSRKIKTSYYLETHLSTRPGDAVRYKDCRVLDSDLQQVCYHLNVSRPKSQPATGLEQPAFYGTLENDFGQVVIDYVEKVLRLQHKCQLVLEFSIGSSKMMENCP